MVGRRDGQNVIPLAAGMLDSWTASKCLSLVVDVRLDVASQHEFHL